MKNSKELMVHNLMRLLPHADIQHHIPGRIRLKVRPSGFRIAMSMDSASFARAVPGIQRVKTNAVARSVVIEYDEQIISPDLWDRLKGLGEDPSKAREIEESLLALWD